MTAVFTVEDGTIVADANSYVSVAEADDFLCNSLTPTEWDALTTADRERLLIASTRWLDQQARWYGTPVDDTGVNDLRWPRSGVCDRDDLPIAEDEIPVQLRQAVMELALFLSNPERNPTRISDNQGFEEITVDVITLRFFEGYDPTVRSFMPGLNTLLQGLGSISTASGRQFAPISRV